MTQVTPEVLVIPYFIFGIVFLSMFALLTEFALPKRNSFVCGMLLGILIYSMIIHGINVSSVEILPEWFIKFVSELSGAVLFITLIIMIVIGSIFQQFTNKNGVNWLTGIAVPFSIFEVYFTLTCIGNIPFVENLVLCSK